MKLLILSILVSIFSIVPVSGQLQEGDSLERTYDLFDSLIHLNDSLGIYSQARQYADNALKIAEKEEDADRQTFYQLKLAKYYYLEGNTEQSLIHFRLYAMSNASSIPFEKELEMQDLENAYLDEIDNMYAEWALDKELIDNLQYENSRYITAQEKISLAIKIGLGALLVIFAILIYIRIRGKKDKDILKTHEQQDLIHIGEQNAKLNDELARRLEELSRIKEAQQHNLTYARNIQLSLLPASPELISQLPNSFIFHIPRDIISGDFYSVYTLNGKTVLAVFDCPGHGINAAHSTVVTHNIFQEIVRNGITTPSMILTMLDQKLKHETQKLEQRPEMISGVKMAVCSIDNTTKEVEYAGCHFPLMYVHLDQLHFVHGNRFPVGDPMFSDKFYTSSNIRLSTGDMLYLSTDGFYSQLGGRKKRKFLRSSMVNLFKTIYNQDLKEQQFILEKVHQEWKARGEQTDDVLVLGFRL